MRILVHEFVSGGGCAGREAPTSLVREGLAMRTALVADLAAIGRHDVVMTTDGRFHRAAPAGVEVVDLSRGRLPLGELMASADAVWIVAPETGGCLERLASRVERTGKALLGSSAAAIRRAADKARLPRRLARAGVRHPESIALELGTDACVAARHLGYPLVLKPRRGAGGRGVHLVHDPRELRRVLAAWRRHADRSSGIGALDQPLLVQRYVRGTPASVSLLADGRSAVVLAVNAQRMRVSGGFSYRGGSTPLDHPHAAAAADAAVNACATLPGLRGFVGVDLVLSDNGPVVIEVNPRLTTAYLGVRAVLDENIAALTLAACRGVLPARPRVRQRVRFTASGVVAAA